jgi:hypothetical protein
MQQCLRDLWENNLANLRGMLLRRPLDTGKSNEPEGI